MSHPISVKLREVEAASRTLVGAEVVWTLVPNTTYLRMKLRAKRV